MDLSDLRQAAIDLLEHSSTKFEAIHQQSPQELIHELRVHQIELEMQNEELRRSQLEVEESREKFVALFDFAPVGYLTLDAANRIIEANLTIAKLLGVERGTLAGQVLGQYVTPEDALRLYHHLRDIGHLGEIGAAGTKTSCELTLKKADGGLVRVRLDSVSVGDDRRSITIADLSENAELIRAKQESDERLRVLFHALPIPVAYVDRTGKYQFNNAAHQRWFKISGEPVIARHVKEVLGDEIYQTVESCIERVLAGHACSCRLELPGGQLGPRSVEVHYAVHRDETNEVAGFYELMIDVSANLRFAAAGARRAALEEQLAALSARQRAVFELLMAGKSNKAISAELDRGMRTVERERHDILQLLGVESINELLVKFAGLTVSDEVHAAAE